MKKLTVAVVAHVDAGKTTLSEAMLLEAGIIRKSGRVDNGDTVMDSHVLEKKRGITIFAGEASVKYRDAELNFLDTPGHVDFSPEAERMLQAADAALLVISGSDGVQAHTRTLWRLLKAYRLPVFIFVTKMDLGRRAVKELLEELCRELDEGCIAFYDSEKGEAADRDEALALLDESLLERVLAGEKLPEEEIRSLIFRRRVFPVFFGSGLKNQGVEALLQALSGFAPAWDDSGSLSARVIKISYDEKNNRLTHLKVTGGKLKVREMLGEEKIVQIRRYTGARFVQEEELSAGSTGTVLGPANTRAGQLFGSSPADNAPLLEPVMTYRILLPAGNDPKNELPKLLQLAEEDPTLHIRFDPALKDIHVDLMGEIQADVLKALAKERFDLDIGIGEGRVLYRETITGTVEGVGHYEPLRHYAEVHLLMEPLSAGSGLVFGSSLSLDVLDRNWQRLILTHLAEKVHKGVLTGSPVTDMRVTLAAGKAHLKHTEGGDFRQATYRALRQGLMEAARKGAAALLEPYYAYRIELPQAQIGRAITDMKARFASVGMPETDGETACISGFIPVTEMNGYSAELASYSGGLGKLSLAVSGYGPCHNSEKVMAEAAYDPEADLDNSPDSVFCARGAGFAVNWREVPQYMHLESVLPKQERERARIASAGQEVLKRSGSAIEDRELEALMEREFGPIKRPVSTAVSREYTAPAEETYLDLRPHHYIIDGYNLIFAWDELDKLAKTDLSDAREKLMTRLINFASFTGTELVLVFDGYKVAGGDGERFDRSGIHVAFTREHETADMFIERFMEDIGKNERVAVVTNDNLIRLSAVRTGILRMRSESFIEEYERAAAHLNETLNRKTETVGNTVLP